MRLEQRAFVDGLLVHIPAVGVTPPPLSDDQRTFVDTFLSIAREPVAQSDLDGRRRIFVDRFVALALEVLPTEDAAVEFQRVVMARWQAITWRVQGAVAASFAEIDHSSHLLLRVFEDTPSLLGPLGKARDEVSHSKLFGWALTRSGILGRDLRRAFLSRIGAEQSVDGWLVTTESTLGPGCRVDIDILVPGQWRCLVEMKVDAQERDNQLDDYRQHLDANCEDQGIDGDLVFLTLSGRSGDGDSDHHAVSFRDVLLDWLPLVSGTEPDALFLRLWLVTIAQDLCNISQTGPVATWGFSRRIAVLRFLEDLGEAI